MKEVILYIPNDMDYWYEAKLLSDQNTMFYNKGYESTYIGYDFSSGCIDFPKEKWKEKYRQRQNKKHFFAYIQDKNTQQFVGYVGYVQEDGKYMCDVVVEYGYRHQGYGKKALQQLCKQAKKNGINVLYDIFEVDREDAVSLFIHAGFQIIEYQKWMKDGALVEGVLIEKRL